MDEITNERKLELIDRDIEQWQEIHYAAEIRHQVHKRIKSPRVDLKAFEDEMVRATKAVRAYEAMRAEVEAEIARADEGPEPEVEKESEPD